MKILRVFNNNVVLALDEEGQEVVLTGRGLGFQARAGQKVREELIARRFVPADGRDPDNFGQTLAAIEPTFLELANEALVRVGTYSSPTVVALADHISFAIERVKQGIEMEYPLFTELTHLYPQEMASAREIVQFINERAGVRLPAEEAAPITLHLVNAAFNTGDLQTTYKMTGVFSQIFEIIETSFDITLDRHSVNAARFITHLRYFFVRAANNAQIQEAMPGFVRAIKNSYPDAFRCASRIHDLLELRLGTPITNNETIYLTIHIARLAGALED